MEPMYESSLRDAGVIFADLRNSIGLWTFGRPEWSRFGAADDPDVYESGPWPSVRTLTYDRAVANCQRRTLRLRRLQALDSRKQ